MKILPLAALLAVAATPVLADDTQDSASGSFRSGNITLRVNSGVAFHSPSFIDKSDAIIVAVSNARLNPDSIADYADRRRVLETRIKGPETGIVYFEFKPEGAYRGMSYSFAPGNGCGYCAGDVSANTEFAGGRLSGKLADTERERSFDITFATPVLSDDHGPPLPADGGAPGRAFFAYHKALASGDRPALRATMSRDQQQYWSEVERRGKLGAWLGPIGDAHPTRSVSIDRGYATGTKAVLLIAGESAAGKVSGEVILLKEDGAWRVDDEITEPVRK